MTTFKEIRGTDILALSSDPANPELGQIWYNSSSGTLKGSLLQVGAWSAGNNTNSPRTFGTSVGLQNAALLMGSQNYGPLGYTNKVESYNGTSWTATTSMNTTGGSRNTFGTQTAAIATSATPTNPTASEFWNGSAWTNTSPINSGRVQAGAFGISTAGVIASTATELWNGSAWTTNPTNLNSPRASVGTSGTQTAAVLFGGGTPGNATELWNGSTWTSSPATTNTARSLYGMSSKSGSQTAALGFGGYSGGTKNNTESYNGTSWTSVAPLTTARYAGGGTGTQTAAIVATGDTGAGFLNSTEKWNGPSAATKTITVS